MSRLQDLRQEKVQRRNELNRELEEQLTERDQLEARREEINAKLEELRTRIEREAIEAFNEHIETIVDLLDYGNLARIWLGYRNSDGRGDAIFELHVTRQTDDGTTYEDSVAHLSESEREVIGLVLALAGYLVHDAHEEMPFILPGSLEAIDSERIAQLVKYIDEYASYIVVALLPEDADALDDEFQRITAI